MKKIFSILSLLALTIVSSVVLVACGDDYKNMYLEVEYVLWSNNDEGDTSGQWTKVDASKGLDFVLNENTAKTDDGGQTCYSLKMRVNVKGTKKDVDYISVSCTGSPSLQLKKSTVSSGEAFEIKVYATGSANLFFTPSIKSDKKAVSFPINLYAELDSISQNATYTPAVVKGGVLELNKLTDLIVYAGANGMTTNQMGVVYALEDVDGVTLDTTDNINRLSVSKDYADDTITLRATSVYSKKTSENKDIECDVTIKVVDNIDQSSFLVNYASNITNSPENNKQNKITQMDLYPSLKDYNSSTVVLSGLFNESSSYGFTSDVVETRVFVDGKDVTDGVGAYHGLTISKTNTTKTRQQWTITAESYLLTDINTVQFVVGLKGYKFTGSKDYNIDTSTLRYSFEVQRLELPRFIRINGVSYTDKNSLSMNIYNNYEGKNGLALNVDAGTKTNSTSKIVMKAYTKADDKTYAEDKTSLYAYSHNGANLGKVDSGINLANASNTIYLKYGDGECPSIAYVEFSVLTTPASFEGKATEESKQEYITITMTLNTIGEIDTVSSSSSSNSTINNVFDNKTLGQTIQAGSGIEMYLNLSNSQGTAVTYAGTKISSNNDSILLSGDNINFQKEIDCGILVNKKLYVKGENGKTGQLTITTPLGRQFVSRKLSFVSVTTDSNPTFSIKTDNSIITSLGSVADYDGDENIGNFYAMQFNSSADFVVAYGASANNYVGISKLIIASLPNKTGISQYGADVFKATMLDSYSFNLRATTANLTSTVKIAIKYNTGSGYSIAENTAIIYLEIASYIPVSNVQLSVSDSEVYYVNSLIDDKAKSEIALRFNTNASTYLSFSDQDIEQAVNSNSNSKITSLYYVEVSNELAGASNNGIESLYLINGLYLNMETMTYGFKLSKPLTDISNINIKFTLQSYKLGISKTVTATIRVVDFVKSTGIELRGLNKNNNINLSLQSEDKKSGEFTAYVSNSNATYKMLDYQLYELNQDNADNNFVGDRIISSSILSVEYVGQQFKLRAVGTVGGKFVLRIFAVDSFNDTTKVYEIDKYVVVTISDGAVGNPFYLSTKDDVANIQSALDKHYVIANDIDLSNLTQSITGEFTGSVNGIMTSYDADNGVTVMYTQSLLKNLNINNTELLSLFEKNSGTLKNIVMSNVKFNIDVKTGAGNEDINIGALVGENAGTIVNCSAIINAEGTINIEKTNETTSAKSYNIGALMGKNTGNVYFYDEDNCDLKQYTNYRQMAEYNQKLTINLRTVGSTTSINIGGAIGDNAGKFVGNYLDFNQDETEYLTAYTDISFVADSTANQTYTANIGGFAGLNGGTIKDVATKGCIMVAGNNINAGGIAGNNTSKTSIDEDGQEGGIVNCATFSCEIVGRPYSKGETVQEKITNQNIGGAVGLNSGDITTVYVLFVKNSRNSDKFGLVKGVDIVGGLVGKMTDGTITVGNVQGFVDDACVVGEFAGNKAEDAQKSVAGLVGYASGGKITNSYAKVNISTDSGNVATLANGSVEIKNSFYAGNIQDAGVLAGLTINSNDTTYSLVKGYVLGGYVYGKLLFNGEVKAYYYYDETLAKELWTTSEPTIVDGKISLVDTIEIADFAIPDWTENSNWTNDYKQYNSGLPVILYNSQPTLLALAESLVANVADDYFKAGTETVEDVTKVYTHSNGLFFTNGTTSTAIVFLNHNTFNLVKKNADGLVDISVLPNIASKSYYVEIISGADTISLVGNYITFKKAGRVELEFVSTFNPNAKDRVVIFALEPINDFEIVGGNKISMTSNSALILSLIAKYNGQTSQLLNNYLYVGYTNGEGSPITVSPLGDSFELGENTYYAMDDIQLEVQDFEGNEKKDEITIDCYLDLSKFVYTIAGDDVDQKTLMDLFNYQYKIASQSLTVTLYQRATSIVSNLTDTKVATSQSVDISIEVLTGYIDKELTGEANASFECDGQYLTTTIADSDNIQIKLSTQKDLSSYKLSSVWDLFNTSITYQLNADKTGYVFNINIELKEKYKDIASEETFEFGFAPTTNTLISKNVKITFEPQSITTLRIENFKSGVATLTGDSNTPIVEYTSSETQSSIVVPGKSGLAKIFVEPTFARVDELVISSSNVTVNGQTYTIYFQQMLYDQTKECYVSYQGYTSGNNSLRLVKNSYIDTDGEMHYTGVVYVRTILENAVALDETFTLTVVATEYARDENGTMTSQVKTQRTATKILVTQFNPGVYVSSNGIETKAGDENVYLIEKSSNSYEITARIVGYQANQNPELKLDWKNKSNTEDLTDEDLTDYVSYSQGKLEQQSNGDYLVTWSLTTRGLIGPIVATISISVINENMLTDTITKEITLYPVDYIPTQVALSGTADDVFRVGVNSSKSLDIVWKNKDGQLDSDAINKSLTTYISYFYLTAYDSFGNMSYTSWEEKSYTNYKLSTTDGKLHITGLGEDYITIVFGVKYWFAYSDDKFEIKFANINNESGTILTYTFKLDLRVETTEEEPEPIYTVDDLKNMGESGNYILMNDLTLEDWTPLTAQIASLDGNSKRIFIKSFSVATSSEISAGLFASLGENCIIKNLTIDLRDFGGNVDTDGNYIINLADENANTETTYFGFIAGQNAGLIYNSELINSSSYAKKINIKTASTTSYIGGLVGVNTGNITNSRVGTPYYLPLNVDSDGNVTKESTITTNVLSIKSTGIMGGLVATNSGLISSSYFQNANLINASNEMNDDKNKTAGFVAVNTGEVYNSYTKSKGRTSTVVRGKETYISSVGTSAGFVFENAGVIENSYSNIYTQSSASAVAGFVYRNNSGATISRCYSASAVSSNNNTSTGYATELAFVGVGIEGSEINKLLSFGVMNNCYYLEIDGDEFDYNYETETDMDVPIPLDDTNFADNENLNNFAFVNGSYEQATQGVWTYYANLDKNDTTSSLGKTFLPELTSANQISRSIRYLVSKSDSDKHQFAYGKDYALGSTNNPYIIRNYIEYNNIFSIKTSQDNVIAGSIRLINNINFNKDDGTTETVNTTNGYDLGDSNGNTITVFDGNGMTISGVDIKNYETTALSSLGLFSNIYNAIVKSLNVEYVAMSYTSTEATYSGGLAGTIKDSSVVDVSVVGNNSTITAKNFAGGIAGLVTGKSILYNISADINVEAGQKATDTSYQYVSQTRFNEMRARLGFAGSYDNYLKTLSYSGGIAGVIDVDVYKNATNINQLVVGQQSSVNVTADIAGFVAGYLGPQVTAKRLKSFVGADAYVYGAYIAGGLVGENHADISYSQVSATTSDQEKIDSTFASYILADKTTPTSTPITSSDFGNLSFVRGETEANNTKNIAGGFVGVNYNGSISHSYSKASISANATYIGGFVGATFGGGYETSYSQTYFDVKNKNKQQYIGGMIGYNKISGEDRLSKYLQTSNLLCRVDNFVTISFYDKSQLEIENSTNSKTLDYMVGFSEKGIASNTSDNMKSLYTYYLSYDNLSSASYFNKVLKLQTGDNYLSSESRDISALFDLTHERQLETFENLFMNFDDDIWKKDNKKFTPTLRDNPDLNFYQIKSESDLGLIKLHPNGNFEVVGNITLGNEYEDYVVDVEFTGTLRGKLDSNGNVPTISNIKIKSSDESGRPGAGFFKSTTGANISNVNFAYKSMILTHDKEYVGLLSSDEKNSEVTSVNISFSKESALSGSSVQQFGGLFGNSVSTICTSCVVDLSNCNFNINGKGTNSHSGFGGITGYAKGESTLNVNSMFMNCTFTRNMGYISVTGFEYVGGIAGYVENANINTSTAKLSIQGSGNSNKYVGGAVGYQHNSYLSKLQISATISNSLSDTRVGGIAGYVKNDSQLKSADIADSSARLRLTQTSSGGAYVGGIAGEVSSVAKIENVVAYISGSVTTDSTYFGGLIGQSGADLLVVDTAYAYAEGAETNTGFAISGKNIMAGGLIGYIKSNQCVLSIDTATANGAVWAQENGGSLYHDGSLYLGGLIGAWYNGDSATNLQASNVAGITSHISNTYTTFALEYSQYKLNSGNGLTTNLKTDFAVSGIVGRVSLNGNKLNVIGQLGVSNVIYSSDYVLAVEEKDNIFGGDIVNVTADVLLRDTSQDEYFGDVWAKAQGHLPYIKSLSDLMKNVDVLSKFKEFGSQMKPNTTIQESETFDSTTYKYYLIEGQHTKSSYVDSTEKTTCNAIDLTGTLKGFVLGNGKTIATTESNLSIGQSSVVSNLNVQLNENKLTNSGGSGVIATENNGTIFNCQVDFYFNIEETTSTNACGGGIAGQNNGNILYCYSTGSIENAGTIDFSGIAKANEGFVYSSGAVGILTGNSSANSAGLVSANTGTIYNCFSAVTVSTSKEDNTPISLYKTNNGYIKNCYYDMYANNENVTVKDSEKKILASPLSTWELQTSYSNNLLGNWTNYPMCKLTQDKNDTEETADKITYTQEKLNYFNYGYPIYEIKQTWFDSDSMDKKLKTSSKKGIWTGDGTESNPYLIVNAGTLESINMFKDTTDMHFKLICDITFDSQNGVGIMKNWIGIGQGSSTDKTFRNSATGNFSGTLLGGKRFGADWIKLATLTDEEPVSRKIVNLNGNSLFNTVISGANIQGIEFVAKDNKAKVSTGGMLVSSIDGDTNISGIIFSGEEFNLTNSSSNGLVAGTINSTATMTSITMEEGIQCSAKGSFGALAGNVEGNLIATDIEINEGQFAYIENGDKVTGVPSNAGGLVGKLESGSVTLSNSTLTDMTVVASAYAGGLIGEMSAGNLTVSASTLTIDLATTNTGAMGGLVGYMANGNISIEKSTSSATISDESATSATFKFAFGVEIADKDRVASYTGGVVGKMDNGTINGGGATIDVNQIRANKSSGYAGGVVGYMKAGTVVSVSPNIGEDGTDLNYASCFGGIVGYIETGCIGCENDSASGTQTVSEDSTGVVAMTVALGDSFYADSAKQIGGIAGVAEGGTFGNIELSITNLISQKSETSTGSSKSDNSGIGGLIGVVNGGITLGSLSAENINIESDGTLSNVGGVFGLLKSNSILELANAELTISGLQVLGTNNVGGFAGQYKNDSNLVLGEQLSKLLGQEEDSKGKTTGSTDSKGFADVYLPTDKTTIKPSNFGGLFGYYCSGNLGYTLSSETADKSTGKDNSGNNDDKNEDILPFVNRNSVMASDMNNWKGVEINHVGGIAGLTQSVNILGENEGLVGHLEVSEPSSAKESDLDTTKILTMKYVGGIVGKFEPKSDTDENLTFKNIKNTGKIAGYDMVGGIMGSFSYDKSTHDFEGENEIGGQIIGVNNVGGYFGQLSASLNIVGKQKTTGENESDKVTIKSTATVNGRINVGGLIGQLQKNISIEQITLDTESIIGVVNVGGYVGLVNNVALTIDAKINNTSTDESTTDKISTNIKSIIGNTNVGGYVGNVFVSESNKAVEISYIGNEKINIYAKDYQYGSYQANDSDKEEDVFYMPTSIGGIVGSAKNINIHNVAMTKDTITITQHKDNKKVPSSVGNYILKTSKQAKFEFNPEDDYQELDDMTTGVGGLVGTLDGYYTGEEGEVGVTLNDIAIATNVVVENGINVGGLVGYLNYSKTVFNALNTITVGGSDSKNTVFVAGALGVGGMFGKIANSTADMIASYDSFGNKTAIEIKFGYLNIQAKEEKSGTATQMDIPTTQAVSDGTTNENDGAGGSGSGTTTTIASVSVHGEYVGAFAGVSTSIYEIKLDTKDSAKVTIYNDEGGYYGGIVGKLNGSLGGIVTDDSDSDVCNSSISNNINFHAESIYNYGGLVGLADATDNDVTILGSHGKAFTVDSVRVSANTDNANINIDNDNKQILFYAHKDITHNVTISKTRKYGLRGDMENYSGDDAKKKYADYWNGISNPITGTSGWDAEYTMFRTMELTETGATSSSFSSNKNRSVTSTIYDANNITKVVHSTIDGKILYTIYNNNDYPILYSRLGVATVFGTKDAIDLMDGTSTEEKMLKYQITQKYGVKSGDYGNFVGQLEKANAHILVSNDLRYIEGKTGQSGGAFYNFRSEKAMIEILKETNNKVSGPTLAELQVDYYYIESGDTYYKFNLIFAYERDKNNKVIKYDVKDAQCKQVSGWDKRLLSEDRTYSLFDIAGKADSQTEVALYEDKSWMGWLIATIVAIVIGVAGIIISGGTASPAVALLFKFILVGAFLSAGITGIVSIVLGIVAWQKTQIIQRNIALTYITSNYTGEYGLVSPDMVQPWYFGNGSLVCESDDSIVVTIDVTNGVIAGTNTDSEVVTKQIMYLYSSTSRPAQYGNVITIPEDVASGTGTTDTTDLPKAGDKMPQYVYKNGKYYICMYGLSTSKRYVTTGSNLKLPDTANWYYQNEDGSMYVASDLNNKYKELGYDDFVADTGIVLTNMVSDKAEYSLIEFNKLLDEKPADSLHQLSGYDYVEITARADWSYLASNKYWDIKDYKPSGDTIYIMVYQPAMMKFNSAGSIPGNFPLNFGEYYLTHNEACQRANKEQTDNPDKWESSGTISYTPYSSIKYLVFNKQGGEYSLDEVLWSYDETTGKKQDSQVLQNARTQAENLDEKTLYWGASKKYSISKEEYDAEGDTNHTRKQKYSFYNAGLGESLSYAESTSNGANTTYPIRVTSSNPVLYKEGGTTTNLQSISSQAELANYYIQPIYENEYKATNYYYIKTKTIKSDTGDDYTYVEHYEYDTGYILENVGTDSKNNPIYALTKVSMVDKTGNYIENKFKLQINGVTVWTHYNFNGTGINFKDKLKNNKDSKGNEINLLPNNNTSGYVNDNEFYFNEVILFSGRTYDNNQKFKGGISMYNQKSSSIDQ